MRWLALWLGLFAVYAASVAVDAQPGSDYSEPEAHHLLVAESIVSDGDVDLADEYDARAWRDFYPGELEPRGVPRADGRIHEPQGVGFGLFIAPAYAIAGPTGAELWLAAVAALGFLAAAALARRMVPEPWATRGVLLGAASFPAVAYATTVLPELSAAALLAGATLFAVRVRDSAQARDALPAAAMLAMLPWLGPKFALMGLPVLFVLVRWTLRRGRRFVALVAGEVAFASLVAYLTANDILFGGPTPYAAGTPGAPATGLDGTAGYLERTPRLVTLWLDPDEGLLLWAPVLALAFAGAYLLLRSRRERLATVVAERAEAETAAGLALAVTAVALIVAAFGAPRIDGPWPLARHLIVVVPLLAALGGWGLQRLPRTGALLGAATVAVTGSLLAAGLDAGWVGAG